MKLLIVHYHLRPGGIRRVIELATPHILREFGGEITSVVVATGEAPDRKWRRTFLDALAPTPVEFFVAPAFGYYSEQPGRSPSALRQAVRKNLSTLFDRSKRNRVAVWAHNLGLGRNPFLAHELAHTCEMRGVPLVAHHHDLWFDNRWQRWPEIRRSGFRTLKAAANLVFGSPQSRPVAINHADATVLKRHFPGRAAWLPNPASREKPPSARRVLAARQWLHRRLDRDHAPIWILPCRLLRRKNVAEAFLLKTWLRPEAWLVTTGGVSSADEERYFERLDAAARTHHWRLRLAVLAGDEARKPSVNELLAASEAVLLTSVQEGFGLPYLEAAAAEKPLIARNLPNIAEDLARFGFRFPQAYDEILVHPALFDWQAEQRRQKQLYRLWKKRIAPPCRKWMELPVVLAAGDKPAPVPFSRLTLAAQLEILQHPATESWKLCAPLNPFLTRWRRRAQAGKLQVSPWPQRAEDWLGGRAYGKKFRQILETRAGKFHAEKSAVAAQEQFIRLKLAAEYLYPLLWRRKL